jgi:hypothetical protein
MHMWFNKVILNPYKIDSFGRPGLKPGRTLSWVTSGFDIGPLVLAALGICISAEYDINKV